MTERLVVENVTKTYVDRRGAAVHALQGVNLEVREGEFVAFVGRSGCGKTTLLKIIDGLIEPTRGRVLLDGNELRNGSDEFGFVFQSPSLYPWRSVANNVAVGLEAREKDRRTRRSRALAALELVGLRDRANAAPYTLSGGMEQRVGLARALVGQPSILLMDEPFGQLDKFTREGLQSDLLKLVAKEHVTALFVTHDIEEAIYLADRIVVLGSMPGRILDTIEVPLPKPRWETVLWEHPETDVLQRRIRSVLSNNEETNA